MEGEQGGDAAAAAAAAAGGGGADDDGAGVMGGQATDAEGGDEPAEREGEMEQDEGEKQEEDEEEEEEVEVEEEEGVPDVSGLLEALDKSLQDATTSRAEYDEMRVTLERELERMEELLRHSRATLTAIGGVAVGRGGGSGGGGGDGGGGGGAGGGDEGGERAAAMAWRLEGEQQQNRWEAAVVNSELATTAVQILILDEETQRLVTTADGVFVTRNGWASGGGPPYFFQEGRCVCGV